MKKTLFAITISASAIFTNMSMAQDGEITADYLVTPTSSNCTQEGEALSSQGAVEGALLGGMAGAQGFLLGPVGILTSIGGFVGGLAIGALDERPHTCRHTYEEDGVEKIVTVRNSDPIRRGEKLRFIGVDGGDPTFFEYTR